LAAQFGIEIGFRAELSNHIHLVLRTRPDVVDTWSDEQVVRRWLVISHLAKSRNGLPKQIEPGRVSIELAKPDRVQELRQRLSDPSYFMGTLCEYIARRSNREDACRGHFWEDRFKIRELSDEGAILVCGIYVDLNQIRAGEASTPETSRHTSAFDRIQSRNTPPSKRTDGWMCELTLDERGAIDQSLVTSRTGRRASDKGLLPISLDDYLALLDVSGRMVRDEKCGAIPKDLEPILDRLGVRVDSWSSLIKDYHEQFGHFVGKATTISQRALRTGRRWYRGKSHCAASFR